MIDLADAPGVVAKVDDALHWFKANGSRHPLVGHWAGVSLPAEIAALIDDLDEALTRFSPAEAGVSSEKWLVAWRLTRRASDAIREGVPGVGIQESEDAVRSVRNAFKRPRPDRVSPPDEDDVKLLLHKAKISRMAAGTGSLDTEPVVFLCGEHQRRLDLIDVSARRLGYVVPTYLSKFGREDESEFRDADGRRVLTVNDTGKRRWFVKKRSYDIHRSDGGAVLTVRQTDRRSWAIRNGTADIGTLHRGGRGTTFVIEDHVGRIAARIAIARVRQNSRRVDVAVELEDSTCVPLRNVALVAGLIAEIGVIFSESGV